MPSSHHSLTHRHMRKPSVEEETDLLGVDRQWDERSVRDIWLLRITAMTWVLKMKRQSQIQAVTLNSRLDSRRSGREYSWPTFYLLSSITFTSFACDFFFFFLPPQTSKVHHDVVVLFLFLRLFQSSINGNKLWMNVWQTGLLVEPLVNSENRLHITGQHTIPNTTVCFVCLCGFTTRIHHLLEERGYFWEVMMIFEDSRS